MMLVGWGFAWEQHRALLQTQGSQEAVLAERKTLWNKSLDEANKRSRRLEAQLAELQKSPVPDGETPREAASSHAPTNRPGPPPRPGTTLFATLKENPAFAKLWAAQQKAQLDGHYSALFKNLNLKGDDLDKFKDLLVEKQNAASEVLAAARAQGLNPRDNKDAFTALMAQNYQELEKNLSSQLGPEKYLQYQQYEQSLPQRSFVNQLDQRLSYSNSPLQPAQMEQLVQLLAQNSNTKSNPTPNLPGTLGSGRFGAKISDATIAQAQAILVPDQLAALIQLRSEQQLQQQLAEVTRTAARTANSASTAPTGGSSSTGVSPKTTK